MTVIDLHILQAYPPSLLNRDELGQPKTAMFGGVTRTRISSQSLKRAQRLYAARHGLVPDEHVAARTRNLPTLLAARLTDGYGLSEEDGLTLAVNTVWGMGLLDTAGDSRRTNVLLFCGASEIDQIAAGIAARGEELRGWAVPIEKIGSAADAEQSRTRSARERKADCPPVFRDLGKAQLGALDATRCVDVALYGRFLAEDRHVDVDAASSTAHAFSVGEHHLELDYFTAVDDLDERGAGFLDTGALTAPLLYRYSNLDTGALAANLAGDHGLARLAARAWLTAAIHATPNAKKASTAPATRPLLVLAVTRDDQALSLANAFLRPVRQRRDSDEGEVAVAAIADHWIHLGAAYGHHGVRGARLLYVGDAARLPAATPGDVVGAEDLVTQTVELAFAHAPVPA